MTNNGKPMSFLHKNHGTKYPGAPPLPGSWAPRWALHDFYVQITAAYELLLFYRTFGHEIVMASHKLNVMIL